MESEKDLNQIEDEVVQSIMKAYEHVLTLKSHDEPSEWVKLLIECDQRIKALMAIDDEKG